MFQVKEYLKDMITEYKAVEWVAWQQVMMLLIGISITIGILSLFLLLSDMLVKYIVELIINL